MRAQPAVGAPLLLPRVVCAVMAWLKELGRAAQCGRGGIVHSLPFRDHTGARSPTAGRQLQVGAVARRAAAGGQLADSCG